jgi:exodeoxyribonuclease-3
LRIDHLLLSPDLAKRLAAAGVDRAVRGGPGASDHAPAWIELDVAQAGRAPARRARKAAASPRATKRVAAGRTR